MRRLFFPLLFVVGSLHAAPANDWFAPAALSVRMSMLPRRDFTSVTMTVAKNHDTRIETSGLSDGKNLSGVLMLISGNYMVTAPGLVMEPGREIGAIDAPILISGLTMKLLARGAPDGPQSIDTTKAVNFEETKHPLELSTQSTTGEYAPPWSASGSLQRESPDKISFALVFHYAGEIEPMTLSGSWTGSTPAVFADKTSIAGWRVFYLAPGASSVNSKTYTAQEIAGGFRTIGALRAYAKKKAAKAAK